MNYIRGIETDCTAITVYYPGCAGDTQGPYYGRMDLIKADDKRMIGLERAQARQELYGFLVFATALTYLFCSLL
jgi:hypothetical protein